MVDSDRARAVRDEIEDIEFHDARVDRISCLPEGDVLFQFNHVDTYHTDEAGHREVWSSTGVLRFVGVTSLHIDGMPDERRDWIMDGTLFDKEGIKVPLGFTVGSVAAVERVEIQFYLGGNVRIACSGVVWESLDPNHKLEDWDD